MGDKVINIEKGNIHPPWWLRLLYRGAYRARHALVPVAVAAAVPPAGWIEWAARHMAGTGWVALVDVCAAGLGAAWVKWGLSATYDRVLGAGAIVVGGTWATAISIDPTNGALYGAWIVPTAIGAGAWWFGPRLRALVELDRMRRKVERGTKVGRAGARLVDMARDATGAVRMRIKLGAGQGPGDMNREQLAHDLDVPAGLVRADRDARTGRVYEVRVLAADTFDGPPIRHPALVAGATDEGGPWAPGSRSILDGIPIGQDKAGATGVLELIGPEGMRHGALFGMTGSGKSVTVTDIVIGLAACRDALVMMVDTPKRGATGKPVEDALDWLEVYAERVEAVFDAYLSMIAYRSGTIGASDSDKWPIGPDTPATVLVVEEAAALFSRFPELADKATEIGLLGRQAAAGLLLLSQGGDFDSIPTELRAQLRYKIAHKMDKAKFRTAWPEAAAVVDMALFEVPGLLYMKCGGTMTSGEGIEAYRAYDLSEHADRRRLAALYATSRARLDPGSVRALGRAYASRPTEIPGGSESDRVTMTGPARPDPAAARSEVADAVAAAEAQAAKPVDLPAGEIGDVYARATADDEGPLSADDEAVRAKILVTLAGGESWSRADLVRACESSDATVLRRLGGLRVEGRVRMVGAGAAARWELVPAQVG